MTVQNLINPLARFLIAFIFVASGAGKIFSFRDTSTLMASVGFPTPNLFLIAAILIEVVGGVALMLGLGTRYAAASLIVFIIPATLIFHTTSIGDPVVGQEQIAHTLKNIAIMGGLLKFVADGGGTFSLDSRFERREVLI